MKIIFRDALVYTNGTIEKQTMFFDGSSISPVSSFGGDLSFFDNAAVVYNTAVFPGFCDVHVHFREPGFSYKETIAGGSLAAAAGGYTAVMTMPNLSPVPDSVENIKAQLDIIERDSLIPIFPYAAITRGEAGRELVPMDTLADYARAFSDDGKGVQDDGVMEAAMQNAKRLDRIIAAHCELNSLLNGGYIHDGEYAKRHGHRGICSASEYEQVRRDIELVKKTGCKYHVCHVSTKESVELIRQAKAEGVDISCETGPHYLVLDESNLIEHGRFKMNPPLRSKEDRDALIQGIADGTVDMIATDHAPHSEEEKSRGLEKSAMGVVGLETAFATMYTYLVKTGIIRLEKLIDLMSTAPRRRFGIDTDTGFNVFSLDKEYKIDSNKFHGKGRATPFEGMAVYGENLLTVYNGKIIYENLKLTEDKKDAKED